MPAAGLVKSARLLLGAFCGVLVLLVVCVSAPIESTPIRPVAWLWLCVIVGATSGWLLARRGWAPLLSGVAGGFAALWLAEYTLPTPSWSYAATLLAGSVLGAWLSPTAV